jgi:hypothetical protein
LISLSSAAVHLSIHLKVCPFFRRLVSGLAIWANPWMNGCW